MRPQKKREEKKRKVRKEGSPGKKSASTPAMWSKMRTTRKTTRGVKFTNTTFIPRKENDPTSKPHNR